MLSLRRTPHGTVGLDLDGAYVAAAQAGDGQVARAVSTEVPPGLVADGEVTDAPALGQFLKEFFKTHDLPRNVRLGVANQQIVVRSLELPKVDDESEREAAVRFQAAEAIAMPLDEAVLDYQVVGESTSAEGTPRMHVVVVAAREAMVLKLVEATRGAGLKPHSIDLNAFALIRTLANGAEPTTARAYCHLAGVTNLAIAAGRTCLFTRALSPQATDDGAAALAEQVRLSIDFYMAQPYSRPVGDMLLSGPGSLRHGLAEELTGLIGLPVSVAAPLGSLDSTGLNESEDPHRHTVAAGLALGAAA
jgi:type IV pilus assembly protein PilM